MVKRIHRDLVDSTQCQLQTKMKIHFTDEETEAQRLKYHSLERGLAGPGLESKASKHAPFPLHGAGGPVGSGNQHLNSSACLVSFYLLSETGQPCKERSGTHFLLHGLPPATREKHIQVTSSMLQ